MRYRLLCLLFAILPTMCACASEGSPDAPGLSFPAIPELSRWEQHMRDFGSKYCDEAAMLEQSTWEGGVWYYDGMRVYYQIADYSGDARWIRCARFVRSVYRRYVLESAGRVPGWRVFPHGLVEDFLRTQDQESRRAALLLASDSVFAHQGGGENFELSRETAYLIHAFLSAEVLGARRNPTLETSVRFALAHLDQWSGSRTASYVKPFMLGLTAEALIRYYEETGDERIPPALMRALDWLHEVAWDSSSQSFRYIVCKTPQATEECRDEANLRGAPDLNLLIAPAYAWAYRKSGELRFRERGDSAFSSGVRNAWLGNGKQFSQNYRWSFDFVRWRKQ